MNETIKLEISKHFEHKYEESAYKSQAQFAKSLGLTKTDATNLLNNKWIADPQKISEAKWQRIAEAIGYKAKEENIPLEWQTARTPTTKKIWTQLEICQRYSATGIFCDEAGLGKSHTAKYYMSQNENVFMINCGNAPTRALFVREVAKGVGLPPIGKVQELLTDIIEHLARLERPLIIFDEAGDLRDESYLVIKRLYNELEFRCGMYMLGARGLMCKIDRGVRLRKNGFEEVYSRFGNKHTSIFDNKSNDERKAIKREQAKEICIANGITDPNEIRRIQDSEGDLRTVRREILKIHIEQASQ